MLSVNISISMWFLVFKDGITTFLAIHRTKIYRCSTIWSEADMKFKVLHVTLFFISIYIKIIYEEKAELRYLVIFQTISNDLFSNIDVNILLQIKRIVTVVTNRVLVRVNVVNVLNTTWKWMNCLAVFLQKFQKMQNSRIIEILNILHN